MVITAPGIEAVITVYRTLELVRRWASPNLVSYDDVADLQRGQHSG